MPAVPEQRLVEAVLYHPAHMDSQGLEAVGHDIRVRAGQVLFAFTGLAEPAASGGDAAPVQAGHPADKAVRPGFQDIVCGFDLQIIIFDIGKVGHVSVEEEDI